jgi:hypothetical protein
MTPDQSLVTTGRVGLAMLVTCLGSGGRNGSGLHFAPKWRSPVLMMGSYRTEQAPYVAVSAGCTTSIPA